MGKQERRAYLEAIRARYQRAGKAGKTAILDKFCAVCGYHRKYALRLLGAQHKRGKPVARKPGPVSRYDTPASTACSSQSAPRLAVSAPVGRNVGQPGTRAQN